MAKQPATVAQLPVEVTDDLLDQYAGQGVSKAQEDNLVPLIYILQKQSPQTEKRDTRYVEGAEPADIWLRNAPNPIVKGDHGILFQPCFFIVDWVEWIPREKGGGFVARHPELPADAAKRVDPQNPNRIKYLRPNGNEVVQTRNHVGYVYTNGAPPLPFVIPMTSSGHTVSRQWMTVMNQKTTKSGKTAPSYACLYRLKTVLRQNPLGAWYSWDIKDEGWVKTREDLERGRTLFEAFDAGTKQVEIPVEPLHDDDKPM